MTGAVSDRMMQNDNDFVCRNIWPWLKEMIQDVRMMDQHQSGMCRHAWINSFEQASIQQGPYLGVNLRWMPKNWAMHHHQSAGKPVADRGPHLDAHRRGTPPDKPRIGYKKNIITLPHAKLPGRAAVLHASM
jgi:hypothetical protein